MRLFVIATQCILISIRVQRKRIKIGFIEKLWEIKPLRAAENRGEKKHPREEMGSNYRAAPATDLLCGLPWLACRTQGGECAGRRGCRGGSGPGADRVLKIY